MIETVLAYIEKDNKYLMLYRNKKKHDLNEGFYIGVGGHLEKGENKIDALIREIKEETGLDVISYRFRGTIYFSNDDFSEVMYLFTVDKYDGELIECNEGTLMWVDKSSLNELHMWEGDKIFLQYLLDDIDYFELELKYKDKKLISSKRIK